MFSQLNARYRYNRKFFDYLAIGSARSARLVAKSVTETLAPASVLDVGCGAGAWLKEYLSCGVTDCLGLDGDYVKRESLLIPAQSFRVQDVAQEFSVGRRFDLVQCLEVGEHLPKHTSSILVKNLVAHADRVLFSAAMPGQGGENHINEQPYEFWRQLFGAHGYVPFDFFRRIIIDMQDVEPWYRYNLLLYVNRNATSDLPDSVARTRIPDAERIPDLSPLLYKGRKAMLRCLPPSLSIQLAILKHHAVVAIHRLKRDS